MSRHSLATLFLAAMAITATGCRQTTATIPGGPAPAGALAPVNPGQMPTLGPFGGNTKVAPPPTGSYHPAGGHIGATAPVAQPYLGPGPVGAPVGSTTNGTVGSGVQVAGWNETNAVVPTAGTAATFGANPSATSNPRSGGMNVIDLTGAPAPPGYRPSAVPAAPVYGGQPSPQNLVPMGPNSAVVGQPQSGWQQPASPPPVAPFQPRQDPGTSYPVQPAPIQTSPPVSTTRTATTTGGPSTEPIDQSSASGNLDWRTPGSQF